MTLVAFLEKLNSHPDQIRFEDTMAVIEQHYEFTPTAFTNGEVHNQAGQNSGSCKLFAFARLSDLSEAQTLACFGDYYRVDVLNNPQGQDHQNIRNFMRFGWAGIRFEGEPLKARA
jgi:hypothetical protein